MEKLLRCSDLGFECEFEGCEDTEEEVIKTVLNHARSLHGFTGELSGRERVHIRTGVQDAFCVPKGGYRRGANVRGL
jgi:predicted small metal-binding protein